MGSSSHFQSPFIPMCDSFDRFFPPPNPTWSCARITESKPKCSLKVTRKKRNRKSHPKPKNRENSPKKDLENPKVIGGPFVVRQLLLSPKTSPHFPERCFHPLLSQGTALEIQPFVHENKRSKKKKKEVLGRNGNPQNSTPTFQRDGKRPRSKVLFLGLRSQKGTAPKIRIAATFGLSRGCCCVVLRF